MYSELTALDASWFIPRDALLETFHRTMHLLPSVKMEMNTAINPQLCDLSCTLSGNLDPLPDEWKIFP